MPTLQQAFTQVKARGRGGLVAYLTGGDPDPELSTAIAVSVAEAGADILEIGVPFSDPLADGPIIQRATERALAAGMTLRGCLDLVRRVRDHVETPIVLFTYANPVLRMGARTFARAAADVGANGVLILDYPVEEAEPLRQPLVDVGLDPIFLISPTTTDERIRRSGELGQGFLYVISRLGVTGVRDRLGEGLPDLIARIRALSPLPVAVGFGISTPEQVRDACRSADAAVVGSALVDTIATSSAATVCERAGEYVKWLKSAL